MSTKAGWAVGISVAVLYLAGAGWTHRDIVTAVDPPVPVEEFCKDASKEKEYVLATGYSVELYRLRSPYEQCLKDYTATNEREMGAFLGAMLWPIVQPIRAGMKAFDEEKRP